VKRCGDCFLWMKKGDCPRERGTMVGGPSANEPGCQEFVSKKMVYAVRETRGNERHRVIAVDFRKSGNWP
jgi:hypothetical protein